MEIRWPCSNRLIRTAVVGAMPGMLSMLCVLPLVFRNGNETGRLTYEPHWPRSLPYTALRPSAVEMRTVGSHKTGPCLNAWRRFSIASEQRRAGCHPHSPRCQAQLAPGCLGGALWRGALEGQVQSSPGQSLSARCRLLPTSPSAAVAGCINHSGCTRRPHSATVL